MLSLAFSTYAFRTQGALTRSYDTTLYVSAATRRLYVATATPRHRHTSSLSARLGRRHRRRVAARETVTTVQTRENSQNVNRSFDPPDGGGIVDVVNVEHAQSVCTILTRRLRWRRRSCVRLPVTFGQLRVAFTSPFPCTGIAVQPIVLRRQNDRPCACRAQRF